MAVLKSRDPGSSVSGATFGYFGLQESQIHVQDQMHVLQLFSGNNYHCLAPHKLHACTHVIFNLLIGFCKEELMLYKIKTGMSTWINGFNVCIHPNMH